ncbi:hypothetical protein CA11_20010 [Gimesia maris]|nr:hypothetical protein CA11_20010 [Gimesia maris]
MSLTKGNRQPMNPNSASIFPLDSPVPIPAIRFELIPLGVTPLR